MKQFPSNAQPPPRCREPKLWGLCLALGVLALAAAAARAGPVYTVVDLNPAGFTGSQGTSAGTGQQAGLAYFLVENQPIAHAGLWHGSAASYVDLHPVGFSYSIATGVGGGQQVGYVAGPTTGGQSHALLWNGSATNFVDLHPAGFALSLANAIGDGQQVGAGAGPTTGGDIHAMLWTGSAGSAVDLNPPGFARSIATGVSAGRQAGSGGREAMPDHALLWTGTADGYVDLHSFLPSSFVNSSAAAIDADGNVVGIATDVNNIPHAIMWVPAVPEPSALGLACFAGGALLRRRRRRE